MKLRPIRSTAKLKRKKAPVKLQASVSRTASRRQLEELEEDEEDYYESSEPNMKLSHAFIVVLILHLIAVGGIFGFNAMKNRQATLAKIAAESGLLTQPAAPATEGAPAAPATATTTSQPGATTTSPNQTTAPSTKAAATADITGPTHEVVPGDTLTRIASRHGTTVDALLATNNLAADAILRVGQILRLPAQPASTTPSTKVASQPSTPTTSTVATPTTTPAATASATPSTTSVTASSGGEIYEVVAGDNPYSIAKRLQVNYQDLLELNGITDPTKLQIGQKLKVPAPR